MKAKRKAEPVTDCHQLPPADASTWTTRPSWGDHRHIFIESPTRERIALFKTQEDADFVLRAVKDYLTAGSCGKVEP